MAGSKIAYACHQQREIGVIMVDTARMYIKVIRRSWVCTVIIDQYNIYLGPWYDKTELLLLLLLSQFNLRPENPTTRMTQWRKSVGSMWGAINIIGPLDLLNYALDPVHNRYATKNKIAHRCNLLLYLSQRNATHLCENAACGYNTIIHIMLNNMFFFTFYFF